MKRTKSCKVLRLDTWKLPPLAHFPIILVLFWKTYDLLQSFKCGSRVVHMVHNVFNYTRGGQIAARGPNITRHSVFSDPQKHSGKSSNLKFHPTSHSKYWYWGYKPILASTPIRRYGPPLNATFSKWPPSNNNCPPLNYTMVQSSQEGARYLWKRRARGVCLVIFP